MKRFKLNWAIPGLLAMIATIILVAWIQTQAAISPDPAKLATQCASCHTMDTQVASWKESTHKDVACTACHADPGAMGWVKMQYGRLQMVNREGEVDISEVATVVPNERCFECHARQMPWVMQDLKPAELDENGEPIRPAKDELQYLSAVAGHDVHLTMDEPLNCTTCHTGVSHGSGPEKKLEHVSAMHSVCLDCHAQEKVSLTVRESISCSACHLELDKVAPQDHQSASFRTSHGKEFRNDQDTCQQCHLNPGTLQTAAAPHTTGSKTQASIIPQLPAGSLNASGNLKDACASCHGLTMPHPQDFIKGHAQGFNEKPELCASCHGTREQGFNLTFKDDPRTLSTTSASCTGCHAQPMPHPESWFPGGHAEAAQVAPATCAQCHSPANPVDPNAKHASAQYCLECHLSNFTHAKAYVAQHGSILARYGGDQNAAGCTQCHTPTQNSCASCHSGGIQDTQWHKAGFVGSHDTVLTQYSGNPAQAGCTQCHLDSSQTAQIGLKDGFNSCTACHTSGLGQKTQWHEEWWWVKHAQTTTRDDVNSCNQCHSYVEPSCSQCHTKY